MIIIWLGTDSMKRYELSNNNDFPEVPSAIAAIQNLRTLIVEAQASIDSNAQGLASAKENLARVLAEPKTPENIEALQASKVAWLASIEAYEASTEAFRLDIDAYKEEIETILKRTPLARQDH